jgi:protein-S-isoprenylcysteine O-methyltransferase Ste14
MKRREETIKTSLFQTSEADRVFVIAATLVFFASLLVTFWDFWQIQGMIFRLSSISLVGFVLFIFGVVLRAIGRITLGRYYAYGLRMLPDHKLVTHGIYKHVRHPISLAAILYSVGIPLIFSSLYGFAVMLLIIPLILYRLRMEERMLIEKFGDEYQQYMRKTKKLIPFIY